MDRLQLNFVPIIGFLIMAGGTGVGLATAISQINTLPPPWQQKAVSVSLFEGHSVPKIDHGYVVFSERIIVEANQKEAIYLQSLTDGNVRRPSFWINGASLIWVDDSAVASSDRLFVVGSYSRSGSKFPINFAAEINADGQMLAIIDMGTYEPELACVASDGSLWTFGQDWGAERDDIPYSLLRNYSATGRLLGSYLTSDALPPARLNFSTRLHQMGGARGRIFLQCGPQSVGAYIGPVSTWVEVDLSDKASQIWEAPPPSMGVVTGLALLEKHEVYCSFKGQDTLFVRGFFKLNLSQPKIASWEPIPGMMEYINTNQDTAQAMSVIGSDGASLVYQKVDSKTHIFFWVKP